MRKSIAKKLAFGAIVLVSMVSAVLGLFVPAVAGGFLACALVLAVIAFAVAITITSVGDGAAAVTFAAFAAGLFAGAGLLSVAGIYGVFGAIALVSSVSGTIGVGVAIWLANEKIDDHYAQKGA